MQNDMARWVRQHFWLMLLVACGCSLGFFPTTSYGQNLVGSQAEALSRCQLVIQEDEKNYPDGTLVQPCTVAKDPRFPYYGYIFTYTAPSGLYDHSFLDFLGWPKSDKPEKNLGVTCNCAGDPINLGTGNEYRDEEDAVLGALGFHRYYNSDTAIVSGHVGAHWRHTFDRNLVYQPSNSPATVTVFRPTGLQVSFTLQAGQWMADTDVADRLVEQTDASGAPTGWTYFNAATRHQETYDASGNLLSIEDADGLVTTLTYSTVSTPNTVAPTAGLLLAVTDPRGRVLHFGYNAQGNVSSVTQPDGNMLSYAYDAAGNLAKVTYPDSSSKQYVYNESALNGGISQPNALTGDIDETGSRFTSIAYDGHGRATMSRLAAQIELVQISYGSNGGTTVTYPDGTQTRLDVVMPNGTVHTSAVSNPCGPHCHQPHAAATYDNLGYLATVTDFKSSVTKTTYGSDGLLNQQVEASGTSTQRTTNITWNATLRVPVARVVLDSNSNAVSVTQWVYNSIGQTLARCEIDPANSAASGYTCSATGAVPAGVRRWTYTYCTAVDTSQCPLVGLMLTATGPRTDVAQTTAYSYYLASSASNCGTPGAACYQAGDLHTVTDPQGHVTTITSYDGAGRITRVTDADGVNTDMTYTPRGWLASRSVGGSITSFTYTPYGALHTVTDADGVVITYGYDAAHRLVKVTDAQGNYVQYTLDAAGNKTAEQVYDTSGTLNKSLSRSFNTLGQLTKVMDGLNHTIFDASASNSYDANGNLVQSADALGVQRQHGYDALNRLVQTIDNYNGAN